MSRWQKPSPNHFQINKLRQYFSAQTAPITNAQDCFNYDNSSLAVAAVTRRVQPNCNIKYVSTDLLPNVLISGPGVRSGLVSTNVTQQDEVLRGSDFV